MNQKVFYAAFLLLQSLWLKIQSLNKYGLGIFVPYGLGATWDAYQLPQSPFLKYVPGFPEEELMSSLAIVDIHPTFAYQINNKLSAGLGVSVFYSTIQLKTTDFKPDVTDLTSQTYQYAPITTNLKGTGMGYGVNLGLLYKATDQLSLGISGKTPSSISLDGDAEVFKNKLSIIKETYVGKVAKDTKTTDDEVIHSDDETVSHINVSPEMIRCMDAISRTIVK